MSRLQQKFTITRRWLASVRDPVDWPAALLLRLCRSRLPTGNTKKDQFVRGLLPRVRLCPKYLNGFQVTINPADMSNLLIYEEIFVDGVYNLDHLEFQPDTIVDCGAYEGYFALLSQARFPAARLIAFEPQPANYAGLVRNLTLNDLRIDARREAVSVTAGEMPFWGRGCGGCLGPARDSSDTTQVEVSNICEIVAELAVERLLLKLDVEGEEAKILPALLPILPPNCAVFFEWHHGEPGFREIERLLNEAGFAVLLCRHRKLEDGSEFIDAFAQRYVPEGRNDRDSREPWCGASARRLNQ